MPEVHDSFCRFCHASCEINITVEDGRPVSVIGANPTISKSIGIPCMNPAFMNPVDAEKLGFRGGDVVEITSHNAGVGAGS